MHTGISTRSHIILHLACALFLSQTALGQAISPETASNADSFDITDGSFLLPNSLAKGKYRQQLGIYYVIVPRAWSLDNVNAPMFNYAGKYAIGSGFHLQGGISTLFVSTRAQLGPVWNHSFGNIHIGVGFQMAFNFGILKEFGFNTILTGWEEQPSFAIGYSFKKSAITVRADLYNPVSMNLSEGGNVVHFGKQGLNGYSITPSLEQRLWKDRVMSIGVKMNYIRYHILAWPAFPVNNYRYFVPEFQIGLTF